jgi:glycerate dehydrogenase
MLDLGSIDSGDLELSALDRVCGRWTRYAATRPAETSTRIADFDLLISNKVSLGANITAFNVGERRNRLV